MAHQTHAETSRLVPNGSSPGVSPHDFGADHHHKPTKAIVGVAILVVLSFVFYELDSKPAVHSSAAPAPVHQAMASSNH